MRVFGSECYAYKQDKQKLDPRCTKGIFLGYDKGSPAYLLYIPETGKVMKYRVWKFPTTRKGVEQQTQTERPLPDDDGDLAPPQHSVSDVGRSEKVPDKLAEQCGDRDRNRVVGDRWVCTIKESSAVAKTFKARYVAKGYSEVRGVDFQETFAPTAYLTSLRVLMQMAAQHDLVLHQMDVKTAYLNTPIDCEIYMDQAEGFEVPSSSGGRLKYKLKSNKSLYGLKQSGRNRNHVLHCFLLENSFVQSLVNNCVYTKHVGSGLVAKLVWVDDIIIAASNMLLMSEAKGMLKERFHMKDLGRLSYFWVFTLSKERFEMCNCKPRSTPSE